MKKYIIQLATEKLECCELFTSVFGKGFARRELEKKLKQVYTNAESDKNNSGSCSFDGSIITIYKSGPNGKLLTTDDLTEFDLETCVHEAVHSILTKTKDECNENSKLKNSTGILEVYYNGNELGRGLNEGLTEWICKKAGMGTYTYPEFVAFIEQLELALGEENVMKLGKGGLSNIASILGKNDPSFNYRKCREYILWTDLLYKSKERIDEFKKLLVEVKELNDQQKKYINSFFTGNPENSYETKLNIIINEEELQCRVARIEFEKETFETYFEEDFNKLKASAETSMIDDELFWKFFKLENLMLTEQENSKAYEFARDFNKIKEKYIKQLPEKIKNEVFQKKLTVEKIYLYKQLIDAKEIAEIISGECNGDPPKELLEYLINTEKLDKISKCKKIKLCLKKKLFSKETSFSEMVYLIDGEMVAVGINKNKINSSKSEHTIDMKNIMGKYNELEKNSILKQQQSILQRTTNNKVEYYEMTDDDIIPLYIEQQYPINSSFLISYTNKNTNTNTNLPIPQEKQSIFEKIRAFFSRKQPKMSEGIGVESSKQIPDGLSHVRGDKDYSNVNGSPTETTANSRGNGAPRGQSR